MKNIYIICLLLFASAAAAFAQDVPFDKKNFPNQKDEFKKAKRAYETAEAAYENESYYEAIRYYSEAYKFNPNYSDLNYKMGQCCRNLPYKYKCLEYFEKAYKLNPSVADDIHLMLAIGYHFNSRFDEAIKEYKTFEKHLTPDEMDLKPSIDKKIKECEFGKKMQNEPVRAFIDNLGPVINTRFNEHSPLVSADESLMLFTSTRENGRDINEEDGQYDEDVYISHSYSKNWAVPKSISENINTKSHDATVGISPDGQLLLVYNGRNGGGNIELSELDGDDWSSPDELPRPINDNNAHESSACFSPDGKRIYFVSDREGGYGGSDIYYCERNKKGRWGQAVNLGPVINTQYNEESVFIHPDGRTLYFSSNGHETMGGLDILTSQMDDRGEWSTPTNVGFPINSPDDDLCFSMSASGRHGYLSSSRADAIGGLDIYRITFLGPEKPYVLSGEDNLIAARSQPVSDMVMEKSVEIKTIRLTIVKGVVKDAITGEPISAKIDITDNEKNELIFTSQSNASTGRFLVSLPSGKNYGIAVHADNYLFHSENFDIPAATEYQEVEKEVNLANIKKDVKIVLRNVFFETGSAKLKPTSYAELGRLTQLLNDMPTLRIEISGHTDNKGGHAANQKLSAARAKAVVTFLISEGIAADRLEHKGYSYDQPVADNKTAVGRALNRRVEFKVLSVE
ncbi:MAG: PD40 domain-containing protein [Bacteroidales bacterium]|nr:PD40 domain-containing protein [Bacteroidales bacterium]